jgi:hypothetical protein
LAPKPKKTPKQPFEFLALSQGLSLDRLVYMRLHV